MHIALLLWIVIFMLFEFVELEIWSLAYVNSHAHYMFITLYGLSMHFFCECWLFYELLGVWWVVDWSCALWCSLCFVICPCISFVSCEWFFELFGIWSLLNQWLVVRTTMFIMFCRLFMHFLCELWMFFMFFGIWSLQFSLGLMVMCCNPTLKQVWGWNSHSQKWELGVLRDSWKLRAWLQGSKHLALRRSLYCWIFFEE
jgi:hypothetical protein